MKAQINLQTSTLEDYLSHFLPSGKKLVMLVIFTAGLYIGYGISKFETNVVDTPKDLHQIALAFNKR